MYTFDCNANTVNQSQQVSHPTVEAVGLGLGGTGDGKFLEMFHENLQTDVISQHHATAFLSDTRHHHHHQWQTVYTTAITTTTTTSV